MSLIITGASGNLGRATAQLLLKSEGVTPGDVVLLTRSPAKLADLSALGAEVRAADFNDVSKLPAAFAGATRVLIISTDDLETRVTQQAAAVDAATAAGAELIAYTSIPNPDPEHNRARVVSSHAATEAAILASGVPHTFLRNALYSEFRAPEAEAALAGGTLYYNSGDGVTAYVSRADCAAAAAAVLAGGSQHAGKAYDITGPDALGGADLAALYASIGGKPVQAVAVDDATWVAGAVQHGMPDEVAQLLASFGAAVRDGQLAQLTGDVQLLTGRPPVSLGEVLRTAGIGQG